MTLNILQNKCGPDVETFLESAPIVPLPQFSAKDLTDIGRYLLAKFRKGKASENYPFTEESLMYIAKRSGNNVRRFLVRMRSALMLGAVSGYIPIDHKFLASETAKARIFIETPVSE